MSFTTLGPYAVILLIVAGLALVVLRDWRWMILSLAALYVGVFLLVGVSWPLNLAIIKLVGGWMAGAALGISQVGQHSLEAEKSWPAGRMFRLLAAGLVLLAVFSILPRVQNVFPEIDLAILQGSLVILTMGLLQLGMTGQTFRVITGLLTVLAGFEVLYAALESSVLVAGLLAGVNLSLAGVGAYLLSMGETEKGK
jgi:hypothetical protein